MGFGFGKNEEKVFHRTQLPPPQIIKTTLDEDGNVEIVSKNFKMKPTQKLEEQPSSEGDTWICWGCGQPTDQDICPVCGKKTHKVTTHTHQGAVKKSRLSFFAALFSLYCNAVICASLTFNFLYTLLKCDSKSIYYESPRKSCSIQHHCYPYILPQVYACSS